MDACCLEGAIGLGETIEAVVVKALPGRAAQLAVRRQADRVCGAENVAHSVIGVVQVLELAEVATLAVGLDQLLELAVDLAVGILRAEARAFIGAEDKGSVPLSLSAIAHTPLRHSRMPALR